MIHLPCNDAKEAAEKIGEAQHKSLRKNDIS